MTALIYAPHVQITQAMIDGAYDEGKRAFHRWYGSHGPTLRPHVAQRPDNPFCDELLAEAWERGWRKDCRRLIAPKSEAVS